MRTHFLVICLIFISLSAWSQGFSPDLTAESCGTDQHHAFLMKNNPAYRAGFLQQKAVLDSIKRAPADIHRYQPQLYTIPVVVHVINLGEQVGYQSNISDQQIHDAIAGLNERYANVNGKGVDIEISFCLANRTPDGCPSSGINRVDGSIIPGYRENGVTWDGSCGVDETAIKDLSKWPTWEYYNIWVVNNICGSVAGYAYYPNGNEYDGTVIEYTSMKYDVGVLAHEIGHGLNIKHTFSGDDEGCPANNDCMEDGDEICDTPPHRRNDCSNNNPCSSQGIWANTLYNWMSYCFPSFQQGRFTADQRERMYEALSVNPRATLLTSPACSNEVNMQITSDASILCPYDTRTLSAIPAGGYFAVASGSGYVQGNILTVTGGTKIVVEYILNEEACSSSVFQDIPVKPVPIPNVKSDEDTLCIGQKTLLQGKPAGGNYAVISGPGEIDSNLLIAEDAGLIKVSYEKLFSGCVLRDTHVVTSFALPNPKVEQLTETELFVAPTNSNVQWLRCDLDYEPVPGATSDTLQVFTSGSYAVESFIGSCRDTSDCLIVELTATHEEQETSPVRIYPNPVHDIFFIDGIVDVENTQVIMYDMRGIPVSITTHREQNRLAIRTSMLASGVYILQINGDRSERSLFRVIKL